MTSETHRSLVTRAVGYVDEQHGSLRRDKKQKVVIRQQILPFYTMHPYTKVGYVHSKELNASTGQSGLLSWLSDG